jgi:malate synthase
MRLQKNLTAQEDYTVTPTPDFNTQVNTQFNIMTPEAENFISALQRKFNPTRQELLQARAARQLRLDQGEKPDFLTSTATVRQGNWKVASCPADLQDRRVEITGPAEPKMVINALNCGAKVFMADFEDSLSPTWENILGGQKCLWEAVRRTLEFNSGEKTYRLQDKLATLVVRPRGWHLDEKNFQVDGEPMSASLFDFGLYFFHNAKELIKRGSGPYFYLPKMESHLEARLWNDVFKFAQDTLGVPQGSIRATPLIETILAAFEMDEILYELKDHVAALNAGRWDYLFSFIKKFRNRSDKVLPERVQLTMTVPFMRAYTELLVQTCHKRGAHAIGGMAAFIPNRRDPEVTRLALDKVRADKERESRDGFDGTWVAHPDLVAIATEIFDQKLGKEPHQKSRLREEVRVQASELLDPRVSQGTVTEAGVRLNINVALQYLERWLSGTGAAAIHNLMEDAATAEISRAQVWQWIRNATPLSDGPPLTRELYKKILNEEIESLGWNRSAQPENAKAAIELLDNLILSPGFTEFLTLPAYEYLN